LNASSSVVSRYGPATALKAAPSSSVSVRQCLTRTSSAHVRCIVLENQSIIPQTFDIAFASSSSTSSASGFSVRASRLTLMPGVRHRLPVVFEPRADHTMSVDRLMISNGAACFVFSRGCVFRFKLESCD
jgi:hypothetical protein